MPLFIDCLRGRHKSLQISSPPQPPLDQRFVCRALEALRIQEENELRREDEKRKLRARLEAETSRLDFVKFMPTAGAGEQAEDGKKDEKKEEEKKLLAELIRSEWGGGGGFF
ncbi:hypothetical protein AAVH_09939 [Aphelenchoides avenae]|nr:hypothetical protein AAVH_09939 [Aphelenchus avenae]